MYYRQLWLAPIFILSLNACSDSTNQLNFAPRDGEIRSYRSFADTRVGLATEQGFKEENRFQTTMLTEYKVEQKKSGYIIHIQPELFRLESDGEKIISFHEPSAREAELRTLMREGFQLQLDTQYQPISFVINAELNALKNDSMNPVTGILNDTLSHPSIAQGINLYEGAELIIPARDSQPELTATVVKLAASHAHIRLEGDNDNVKVFGHIVSEIEGGWIERGSVITNVRNPVFDDVLEMHMVTTVVPPDWTWELDLDYLNNYQNYPMPPVEELHPIANQPSLEQLLSQATQKIDEHRGALYLVLEHDAQHVNEIGNIQFSDPQVFNANGEQLSLRLKLERAATYDLSIGDERYIETSTTINPLGWDDVHLELNELAYIDVTVNWSPFQVELIELLPDVQPTSIQIGDAHATLSPTENDGQFILLLEPGITTHFEHQIKTNGSVIFEFLAYEAAPEWLTLGEKRLLTLLEHGTYPAQYRIDFGETPPNSVTISAIHKQESAVTHQSLRFEKAR